MEYYSSINSQQACLMHAAINVSYLDMNDKKPFNYQTKKVNEELLDCRTSTCLLKFNRSTGRILLASCINRR